jgi:probable phosphoglycerate mutase
MLVRHGETDWNRQHRIQGGSSDTPLNPEGKKQARELALRLSASSIEAIYSSPLKRALETARQSPLAVIWK